MRRKNVAPFRKVVEKITKKMRQTKTTVLIPEGLNLYALPSHSEIASQSKIICREYIFNRLKKCGQLNVKLDILNSPYRPSEVSMELQLLGSELEKLYPFLYQDISRQLNITMSSVEIVGNTYLDIADAMLKSSPVTWGKVVALLSLGSALAQDCVSQGHAQFVNEVVDCFAAITEKYLAEWIAAQGGWSDILRAFRTTKEASTLWALTGLGAVFGFALTLIVAF